MRIRVNRDRLSNLSRQLRTLENDISDITGQIARLSQNTVQPVKYQNSKYRIRRACDNVLDSVSDIKRASRDVCYRLEGQSRVLGNAVSSYRENDVIKKVNSGLYSCLGSNLSRVLNYSGYGVYVTVTYEDLFGYY